MRDREQDGKIVVARDGETDYAFRMVEMPATIRNSAGIHCRPSASIVKALAGYPGVVEVITSDGTCDPRSIMALISLGLHTGTVITVRVEGPDEEDQCQRVVDLFETHYDFPHRDLGQDTQVILHDLGVEAPHPKRHPRP